MFICEWNQWQFYDLFILSGSPYIKRVRVYVVPFVLWVKSLFMTPLNRHLCSIKGTLKFHYGLHNHKDSIKTNTVMTPLLCNLSNCWIAFDRSSHTHSVLCRRLLTFGCWLPCRTIKFNQNNENWLTEHIFFTRIFKRKTGIFVTVL